MPCLMRPLTTASSSQVSRLARPSSFSSRLTGATVPKVRGKVYTRPCFPSDPTGTHCHWKTIKTCQDSSLLFSIKLMLSPSPGVSCTTSTTNTTHHLIYVYKLPVVRSEHVGIFLKETQFLGRIINVTGGIGWYWVINIRKVLKL